MINLILYYIIFTSIILLYGTGYSCSGENSELKKINIKHIFIMFITVCLTSVITYLFANIIFIPFGLVELYPFVAVLLYLIFIKFSKYLVKDSDENSNSLNLICLILIFMTITESSTIVECSVISISAVLAFSIFIPFLNTVINRISLNPEVKLFDRTATILLSIIVIAFAILAWNVSWLNKGVFN